jgi:hypothetical protein
MILLVVGVAFVLFICVEAVLFSPWLLLTLAITVAGSLPILISQVRYETRSRRLASRFPLGIVLNVRVDLAQVAALPAVVSAYGFSGWDRRPGFHLQILAAEDGLSFWTRDSGGEPIALVPWDSVGPFEVGPSVRGLQPVIRIELRGLPSFGVGPMVPATYGIVLSSESQMRLVAEELNEFREKQTTKDP